MNHKDREGRLPSSTEGWPPDRETALLRLASRLRGSTVLLVEDDEIVRAYLTRILENLGLKVRPVGDGDDAIAAVLADRPDAVLMDCQLPDRDGYSASRSIRKHKGFRNLPIIALTSNNGLDDERRCLEAGMDAYLTKPVDLGALFAALVRLLGDVRPTGHPTASQPSEPMNVPDLPGIDVAEGLARLHQDWNLYSTTLHKFVRTYGATFEADFQAAIAAGDFHSAHRLAHSLRGAARSLSINELGGRLALLEAAARVADAATIPELLAAAVRELNRVAEGIAAANRDSAGEPDPDAVPGRD